MLETSDTLFNKPYYKAAYWIVVDIVRLEKGLLAEHWDVVEDEATRETSVSGLPMFGTAFPSE